MATTMPTKKQLSAIPRRSKATIALNKKLKLGYIHNYKAPNGDICRGYALIIPGRGVLAFKKDRRPFTPGRPVLQDILDQGGFLSFKDVTFYKIDPMRYVI